MAEAEREATAPADPSTKIGEEDRLRLEVAQLRTTNARLLHELAFLKLEKQGAEAEADFRAEGVRIAQLYHIPDGHAVNVQTGEWSPTTNAETSILNGGDNDKPGV